MWGNHTTISNRKPVGTNEKKAVHKSPYLFIFAQMHYRMLHLLDVYVYYRMLHLLANMHKYVADDVTVRISESEYSFST